MTKKLGPGTVVVDGETYATSTSEHAGETITVRELSVDEGDEAWDAAQEPINPKDPAAGMRVNVRANTRFLLAKGMVEPATTADQVGKWGQRKYTAVLREFNRLNSIEEANPTPPAGSAGLTPPAGGNASPTT